MLSTAVQTSPLTFTHVLRLIWLMGLSLHLLFGCFWVFALLGLAVADRFCPSVEVVFESVAPLTSIWDSLACLALGPYGPFVSPVLCGLRLTRLTCLTCCKEICRVCGVLFFFFPLLLARLSSFTDWCTAHKQQFREQKKV